MNTQSLTQQRDALIERREELTRELKHLDEELRDLSIEQDAEGGGAGNHFADDGSSLGEQERSSTVGGNFKEQLSRIDQALGRIESGTYGICQRCGQEIPVERLEALPYAPYCISCQTHLERRAELFGASPAVS